MSEDTPAGSAGANGKQRHRSGRRWAVLVPVIAALAGLLFTTTARTAAGTSLRDDRRIELTRLIQERQRQVDDQTGRAAELQRQIDETTRAPAGSDGPIAQEQARGDAVRAAAGFTEVHGPGVRVVLDDAPRRPDGNLPAGARPDDVVVHQQDVQSVVNALWAGGAEAMVIMDIRVISTSAVRCVGNTLLLHGRVYSPPFQIQAIGDSRRMLDALAGDAGVAAFRQAADAYGLGYSAETMADIQAPAHGGPTTLEHARAIP